MKKNKNLKHFGDYTDAELLDMSPKDLIKIIKNIQMDDNFIIMTDSYKMTHHLLYPEGLTEVTSYMEARGGEMPYTVFFGLQYYLKKYFCGVRISQEKIDEAREMNIKHFGFDCFDSTMWDHILKNCGGKLPLEIKAIPEGTPIAVKNVLMTIRNTDKKCAALTNVSETLLMKIWATNTVAAYARIIRTLIFKYHQLSSDAPQYLIDFMHHDFGYRGVSSEESGRLMGAAGLSSGFKGTDTLGAIKLLRDFYYEDMAGFSVIASEHSVVCSYGGRHKEAESYRRIIERVKKKCWDVNPSSGVIILSLVSDTYNILNVTSVILPQLAKDFIGWVNKNDIPIKIVVRPDSGDPASILFGFKATAYDKDSFDILNQGIYLPKNEIERHQLEIKVSDDMKISLKEASELVGKGVFRILFERFGSTFNSKGSEVLHPQIGVLQGDGVSLKSIQELYKQMIIEKMDIMNLVLGSGGKYLQVHDRDEQKYAIKAIHVINEFEGELCIKKNPITDSGKASKEGNLKLLKTGDTWRDFETIQEGDSRYNTTIDFLQTVFLDGDLLVDFELSEIRKNADILESEYLILEEV